LFILLPYDMLTHGDSMYVASLPAALPSIPSTPSTLPRSPNAQTTNPPPSPLLSLQGTSKKAQVLMMLQEPRDGKYRLRRGGSPLFREYFARDCSRHLCLGEL